MLHFLINCQILLKKKKEIRVEGRPVVLTVWLEDQQQQHRQEACNKCTFLGFPAGSVAENLPANAGDTGSIPDPGRSHVPRSS